MKTISTFDFQRKVLFSVVAFCILSLFSSNVTAQPVISAQSGCFTVSGSSAHSDCWPYAQCPLTGSTCGNCYSFKITSCNDDPNGEDPDSFQINGKDANGHGTCFSICSSAGDFILGTYSSNVCDTTQKQIVWNGTGNMTTTNGGLVTICAAQFSKIKISLIHHNGTLCTSPCADAILQF